MLGSGLADVFSTALNYDESGFIANRPCALQWGSVNPNCLRHDRRYLRLMKDPFRYLDSSPEVIQLVVQMYARYTL